NTAPGLCVGCATNADCAASGAGSSCNTSTNTCGCTSAADCAGNSHGTACNSNWCGCSSNADCPAGDVCNASLGGQCEPKCQTNADCRSGGPPVCNPQTGLCVQCVTS